MATRTICGFSFRTRRSRVRVTLEFKVQDLWVGAFWMDSPFARFEKDGGAVVVRPAAFDLWVCILPCFPVHVAMLTHTDVN